MIIQMETSIDLRIGGIIHWVKKKIRFRDFPVDPVVKTLPSNAGVAGLIPGQGAKILFSLRPKNQNIKQKQYCNIFNKDIKEGPHFKNL